MKVPALDLIKSIKITSQNSFFKFVKKLFPFKNIKLKYGASLLITSISKLFVFSMSIALSTIVVIFSVSSYGIFNKVKADTFERHPYKYKINLLNPTPSSGLYARKT
jgi:hypothetical protein